MSRPRKTYRKRMSAAEKADKAAADALTNRRYEELLSAIHGGELGNWRHVFMDEFFHLIFERQGTMRLQHQGRNHYEDGHYNAIIRKISKTGRAKSWWIVTDTLAGIHNYDKVKFAIVSPVTYIGKTRSLFGRKDDKTGREVVDRTELGNARYLFAIAVDLDKVGKKQLENFLHDVRDGMYPEPTFFVTSGGGLHLYFCFQTPLKITKETLPLLNRLKHSLTRCLWRYKVTSLQQSVEVHDINQGYRIPGTLTKTERIVHCFRRDDAEPIYYTPVTLNKYIKNWYGIRPEIFKEDNPINDATATYLEGARPLNAAEQRELEKDMRLPAHWSIKTAREQFGEEWYRQVKEKGSVDWQNYPEQLYTSWLKRLKYGMEVSIGHRYWSIWVLAAWAWNCRIPYARLQRDAYDLMERFNRILDEHNNIVPFTIVDCNAALAIYRERKEKGGEWKPIRLSRKKTSRITNIHIEPAKRNYRMQEDHLQGMRDKFNQMHDESLGGDGVETRGRKSKDFLVQKWREEHPDGKKIECARDLGLDAKTIRRWWEGGNLEHSFKKPVSGYEEISKEMGIMEDPKDMGAAVNQEYITDQKLAARAMAAVGGEHSAEEVRETGSELADTINFSEISIENIMRKMGVPDSMIPILKPQIEQAMQSPEFWEQYKAVQSSIEWPPEVQAAYERVMDKHNKK